jgi:hypothetical protein
VRRRMVTERQTDHTPSAGMIQIRLLGYLSAAAAFCNMAPPVMPAIITDTTG